MIDNRGQMVETLPMRMRDFYHSSQIYLQGLSQAEGSQEYFGGYVQLVKSLASLDDLILDLGCGTGHSSYLLSNGGYRVVGSDLSPLFLSQKRGACTSVLHFAAADAFELPFPSETFDIVASFQFIEHIPDVPQVLNEMDRVLRPDGLLVVVSPNLLSPIVSLKAIKRLCGGHEGVPWWGTIQSYRSPFGNSIPQILWRMFKHGFSLAQKTIALEPHFDYREPDLDSGLAGDADSCYWVNPVDLNSYLRRRGWRVINCVGGKSRYLGALASNVQIIACKQCKA